MFFLSFVDSGEIISLVSWSHPDFFLKIVGKISARLNTRNNVEIRSQSESRMNGWKRENKEK